MTDEDDCGEDIVRLIVDCDPGNGVPGSDVDDGLALAFAIARPDRFRLEAITVVAGNTSMPTGYRVARTFADEFAPGVPVYPGAVAPLIEPAAPWRERQDSRERDPELIARWRDVPAPTAYTPGPGERDAASALIAAAAESPGEITIAAVGPLTNIAHALQRRPEFAREVKRIVIMGGSFAVPNAPQEFNFGQDPEAASVVLSSGAPIVLVPLDVTIQTLLSYETLERWEGFGSRLSSYVSATARPWIPISAANWGVDGCLLHDPLALAWLADASVGSMTRMVVDVALSGIARSRPIGWSPDRPGLHVGIDLPQHPPIDVMTSVDNDRLVALLSDAYGSWDDPSRQAASVSTRQAGAGCVR